MCGYCWACSQKINETRGRRSCAAHTGGRQKEEKLTIIQFRKKDVENPKYFDNLEDLLYDISENDLECRDKVQFIYSGNNEFPFDAREQWTDLLQSPGT